MRVGRQSTLSGPTCIMAVKSAGGQVVNGPYAFPGGRRFHFTDPSGNELGVWAEA